MNTIEKDILEIKSGFLCHQVNCLGAAGAGLAKQISQKYPDWKNKYREYCRVSKDELLGDIFIYDVHPVYKTIGEFWIVSLFGQHDFGREKKVYTNYKALETAMRKFKTYLDFFNMARKDLDLPTYKIYFPHGMSSGLAGGDWNRTLVLLETFFPDGIICRRRGD